MVQAFHSSSAYRLADNLIFCTFLAFKLVIFTY